MGHCSTATTPPMCASVQRPCNCGSTFARAATVGRAPDHAMTPDSANARHYDIIIGSGAGAGGGTLAHSLAASGKRILLIERGDFLRRDQLGRAAAALRVAAASRWTGQQFRRRRPPLYAAQ